MGLPKQIKEGLNQYTKAHQEVKAFKEQIEEKRIELKKLQEQQASSFDFERSTTVSMLEQTIQQAEQALKDMKKKNEKILNGKADIERAIYHDFKHRVEQDEEISKLDEQREALNKKIKETFQKRVSRFYEIRDEVVKEVSDHTPEDTRKFTNRVRTIQYQKL